MSLSFGGLGIMSLRRSYAEWSDIMQGKGEIRSLFFGLLVFVIVLFLAYLTNPSENTFRTFLTEQSFRQHLSRLDYNNEDDQSDPENARDTYSLVRHGGSSRSGIDTSNDPAFHFANRASVSLRTPKHVFHSFGICTIAAVIPFPNVSNGNSSHSDHDGSQILDSWFIGAFGKWWRAGAVEAWYHDVVVRSKDEESWSSGILGFKALDKLSEYNGFSFAKSHVHQRFPARGSPPKLRNRERSLSQRNGTLPPRSSTPPPLPKSATLPLHATRLPSSASQHAQVDKASGHCIQPQPVLPTTSGSPMLSRSASALLEQSPIIAEVLRQISISKSAVHDLRTQLTEFQSAATQSHASLQGEVDSYRERRRQEDASKLELKSRTKNLEDSKRHAEGHKRDAEKRLKAAQTARDECTQRMEHLDSEVIRLQQRSVDDEAAMQQSKVDTAKAEQEISEALELKRQEIKVAEDVIAALSLRAKELEEKLAAEKERLSQARERAEIRKQDHSFYSHHLVNQDATTWSAAPYEYNDGSHPEYMASFAQQVHQDTDNVKGAATQDSSNSPIPRPARLSLGRISNFNANPSDVGPVALRSKGYSIFDDDIASLQTQHANFSLFQEVNVPAQHAGHALSPTSSSLIPTGLMSVMDNSTESLARSFQSEGDAYLDKDWRGTHMPQSHSAENAITTSPTSYHGPSFNDFDPFEVRHHDGRRSDYMGMQRATMPAQSRTHSDPTSDSMVEEIAGTDQVGPRRWFSTLSKDKPKKGLNPDAKVFRLSKTPPDFGAAAASPSSNGTFDNLNPNGFGSRMMASASSNTSSILRAFAPSPAERQVLQRAFGGSTNASLERLPSLSRVNSIPSSPPSIHTVSNGHVRPNSLTAQKGDFGKNLPSWLASLPRIGKSNFSPWDDEEPSATISNGEDSSPGSGIKE